MRMYMIGWDNVSIEDVEVERATDKSVWVWNAYPKSERRSRAHRFFDTRQQAVNFVRERLHREVLASRDQLARVQHTYDTFVRKHGSR